MAAISEVFGEQQALSHFTNAAQMKSDIAISQQLSSNPIACTPKLD
jgi:hypothetical protein